MTAILRVAIGIAVLALAGCGGKTADVAGKVTYRGKPVVFGTVTMIGPDDIPKSGSIRPDGTYRVDGVRVGTAKVTVSSPPPPGVVPVGKKGGRGREEDDERTPADAGTPVSPEVVSGWFRLPDKYADPDRSGLSAEVRSGPPVDINLE